MNLEIKNGLLMVKPIIETLRQHAGLIMYLELLLDYPLVSSNNLHQNIQPLVKKNLLFIMLVLIMEVLGGLKQMMNLYVKTQMGIVSRGAKKNHHQTGMVVEHIMK